MVVLPPRSLDHGDYTFGCAVGVRLEETVDMHVDLASYSIVICSEILLVCRWYCMVPVFEATVVLHFEFNWHVADAHIGTAAYASQFE